MYSLLLAVIYIIFISLGLPDSLLGSGWPAMHLDLGAPTSYMGIITMIMSAGTVVSSLLCDRLTKKIGASVVTIISVFLVAIALFGFSFSNKFWMLIVFSVPYGLGAGAIDAALNNYIALNYSAKHMSWLHCFWGVGAIISPFVMSYALATSHWSDGYKIVGYIQLGIGILLLLSLPLWKKGKKENKEETKSIGLIGALKIKGVPLILLGFFAYCAAEATAMSWASTYLVEVKQLSTEIAARFASLFYIGLTFGRFVSGFVTNKLGDRKMIIIGSGILFFGIALLIIPYVSPVVSLVGFAVIGLGCAPIYPCIIHSTPDNFGEQYSGAIIGVQMASAYIGSTFIPPLYGLLSSVISFRILPYFLALFFILMIVMTELTFKTTTAKTNKMTDFD